MWLAAYLKLSRLHQYALNRFGAVTVLSLDGWWAQEALISGWPRACRLLP